MCRNARQASPLISFQIILSTPPPPTSPSSFSSHSPFSTYSTFSSSSSSYPPSPTQPPPPPTIPSFSMLIFYLSTPIFSLHPPSKYQYIISLHKYSFALSFSYFCLHSLPPSFLQSFLSSTHAIPPFSHTTPLPLPQPFHPLPSLFSLVQN